MPKSKDEVAAAPVQSSNTGLAVVERSRYLALADGSDIREAIEANSDGVDGFQITDLVRVPTPAGGGTSWTIPGDAGDESVKELTGILVYIQPRGVLWPSETPSDKRPVLVTHDMVHSHQTSADIGDLDQAVLDKCVMGWTAGGDPIYSWADLPYNQFGSAKNGAGKRCKESRLLFILREHEAFPLYVAAQPGSLSSIRPFIKRLTVPHYRAVVSLSLVKVKNDGGQEYSKIIPRLVAQVDRETGEVVKKLYTVPLSVMAKEVAIATEHHDDDDDGDGDGSLS